MATRVYLLLMLALQHYIHKINRVYEGITDYYKMTVLSITNNNNN